MVDITSPLPPTALNNQALATTSLPANGVLTAQLIDLPEALLTATQPLTLTGALQWAANNNLTIQTAYGAVLFSLPLLRTNPQLAQLLLPWLEGGKAAQLNFTPASDGPSQASLVLAASTSTQTAASTDVETKAASLAGKNLTALILPPGQNKNIVAQPGFSAGRLQNSESLVQTTTSHPATETAAQPIISGLQTPVTTPLAAALQPTAFPNATGQIVQATVVTVVAPGQNLPQLAEDQWLASVIGFSNALQQPVAASGNNLLLLKTAFALPIGTALILKQVDERNGVTIDDTTKNWAALKELLTLSQQAESPLPSSFFAQRLLQMNQNLPGAMLFLLSAMHHGDIRQWLGSRTIEALERQERKALVSRLQDELRQGTSPASDATVGQWRAYHLPWLDQGQVMPLHIYVRRDGGGKNDGDAREQTAEKTRFIVDITLTKLGDMQLDGFVQRQATDRKSNINQFDLMLRSEQALASELRHELHEAFVKVLGAMGYSGQMLFQQGRQGWVVLRKTAGESRRI